MFYRLQGGNSYQNVKGRGNGRLKPRQVKNLLSVFPKNISKNALAVWADNLNLFPLPEKQLRFIQLILQLVNYCTWFMAVILKQKL